MGICGQFIDAANDEQRDRIVEGMSWGDDFVSRDDHSCKCLTGHAEGWFYNELNQYDSLDDNIDLVAGSTWERVENRRNVVAFSQFPLLCSRFGKDRIIRACKARAAKGNRLHEIRAEVYRELVPAGGMNGRYPEDCR